MSAIFLNILIGMAWAVAIIMGLIVAGTIVISAVAGLNKLIEILAQSIGMDDKHLTKDDFK